MSKRIQSACLLQTVKFELAQEFTDYKATLDRKKIKYRIDEQQQQPGGGLIVKLRRQYNDYAMGEYADLAKEKKHETH